jgi:hypothetical protein
MHESDLLNSTPALLLSLSFPGCGLQVSTTLLMLALLACAIVSSLANRELLGDPESNEV